MRVSFVINAFGKRHHLARVLSAVHAQRGIRDPQIIVVDPSSPDGVGDFAEECLRHHPDALVVRCADHGPSHAVNIGAAKADRPFLHVVDGDDVLAPFASAYLIEQIRRRDADACIAQGRFYRTEEDLVFPEPVPGISDAAADATLDWMIRYAPSNMTGTMFRTAFFRDIGGCDERVFVHDYSVSLRACRAGRVVHSEQIVWKGPADDLDRIMNARKREMFHDFNAALYFLLRDFPNLPMATRMLAFRRAAGRARKWALREEGRPWDLKFLALDALAKLPAVPYVTPLLGHTLSAFELSKPVRRP